MTDLTARLEACYSGAVFDVLRDLGHANCVLPRSIVAIDPPASAAGSSPSAAGRTTPSTRIRASWPGPSC